MKTNTSHLIDSLGLVQHVHFETHVLGHTLDLVITRKMDSIIQDTPISGSFLSDHATVLFNLKGSKSESSAKEVWFRKIKSFNLPTFKMMISVLQNCYLTLPITLLISLTVLILLESPSPTNTLLGGRDP